MFSEISYQEWLYLLVSSVTGGERSSHFCQGQAWPWCRFRDVLELFWCSNHWIWCYASSVPWAQAKPSSEFLWIPLTALSMALGSISWPSLSFYAGGEVDNVLVGLTLSCMSHMPHSAAGLCPSTSPTAALATPQHPLSRACVPVGSERALWGWKHMPGKVSFHYFFFLFLMNNFISLTPSFLMQLRS